MATCSFEQLRLLSALLGIDNASDNSQEDLLDSIDIAARRLREETGVAAEDEFRRLGTRALQLAVFFGPDWP